MQDPLLEMYIISNNLYMLVIYTYYECLKSKVI